MGTVGVYLDDVSHRRLIKAAEGKALSGGQLGGEILVKVFNLDARGRSLRRTLELPED